MGVGKARIAPPSHYHNLPPCIQKWKNGKGGAKRRPATRRFSWTVLEYLSSQTFPHAILPVRVGIAVESNPFQVPVYRSPTRPLQHGIQGIHRIPWISSPARVDLRISEADPIISRIFTNPQQESPQPRRVQISYTLCRRSGHSPGAVSKSPTQSVGDLDTARVG